MFSGIGLEEEVVDDDSGEAGMGSVGGFCGGLGVGEGKLGPGEFIFKDACGLVEYIIIENQRQCHKFRITGKRFA